MGLVRTNTRVISTYRILDATLLSADMDDELIQYAEVTISTGDLTSLIASAKTLVAAQGTNTVIELISCLLAYKKGSTTFTINSAGDLQVKYNTSGTAISSTRVATGFLNQASDQSSLLVPVGTSSLDVKLSINKAIELTVTDTGSATEMSDGDGSVLAKITYRVHETGF